MKRTQTIGEEAKSIAESKGYYIPPYKLSVIMKMVSKIVDIITNTSMFVLSYDDAKLVLQITSDVINRVTDKEKAPTSATNTDKSKTI